MDTKMLLNKMLNFLNFCYISLSRYCAYCLVCTLHTRARLLKTHTRLLEANINSTILQFKFTQFHYNSDTIWKSIQNPAIVSS